MKSAQKHRQQTQFDRVLIEGVDNASLDHALRRYFFEPAEEEIQWQP